MEAATNLEDYEYEDPSGKKIKIPAQCEVSQIEGENTLEKGLVIIDANGNEWVWVEVPRTAEVYPNAGINLDVESISGDQCTIIYEDLVNYTRAYREEGYTDTFYSSEQAGFSGFDAYNTAKNNMLKSVYKNGGFWIGRYEVGDTDATASNTTRIGSTGVSNTPAIKKNQIPYNYVTCRQAQELATGGKTSSLMFGIQWDLTCKFLETKGGLTPSQINSDSKDWGNYMDSTILLSQGKYNTSSNVSTSQWLDITPSVKSATVLLTTGASEDTNKMNIYDFAGNLGEWTLETYTNNPCAYRGGIYSNTGASGPASYRNNKSAITSHNFIGFRASLI